MKKYMQAVFLFFCICILMGCMWGCAAESIGAETEKADFQVEPENAYALEELREFFVPHHLGGDLSELSDGEFLEKILFYHEVNTRFPVEVLIEPEKAYPYSVYQTKEGGYYYLFWTYAYPAETEERPETAEYMCLSHSAYLYDSSKYIDYYMIKPGVTTLRAVMEMDPYAEYVPLSRGTCTCSVLGPDSLLQIHYTYLKTAPEGASLYDAMVVKEVLVVKLADSASRFRDVLPCHLQNENGGNEDK